MKKLLACLVVVLSLCVSANAVYFAGYTVSYNNSYSGTFNINKILSVPQFDPSLGTLLNVTIDFGIGADGTINFENTISNPYVGDISTYFWQGGVLKTTNGTLALQLNGVNIADCAWDLQESYAVNLTGFDGGYDFAGPSGFSTVYLAQTDGGQLYYYSDLASFIGNSTVAFNLIGTAVSAIQMPGNGMSMFSTIGSGEITITYEYIPEPATMALLSLGGLLLCRKR